MSKTEQDKYFVNMGTYVELKLVMMNAVSVWTLWWHVAHVDG